MTRRLVALVVGLTLIVLAVHDIPLIAHLRAVERDRVVTALERDAFTLSGLVEEELEAGAAGGEPDARTIDSLATSYATTSLADVIITDRHGIVVVATGGTVEAGDDLSDRSSIALALGGIRNSDDRMSSGAREIFVAVPVLSGLSRVGAVEFARPMSAVSDRAAARARAILVAAAISLLLAGLLGWVLARTFSEPLRRLRRATRRIAAGEHGTRAEVPTGPPEIRDLATDFNEMVERLDHALAEQRSFAGDASHQLRTPITTLGLRIEQLLDRGGHDERTRAALESARGELRRMEHLVEGLLALARAGGSDATLSVVDVSAIVTERAEAWEALAAESDVTLATSIAPGLAAEAVPGALEQVVDNLIDNALEVAPAGSRVEVAARSVGTDVVVTVADEGPGLRDDELERAFERFWRGAHGSPGGSGVGLAVVARLVRASRGAITLRHAGTTENSGLVAELRLRTMRL